MVAFATQVKRRRGTTAQNDAFTGAEGEIVVDMQKHTLRVHDGVTLGGFEMARQTDLNDKADISYVDEQLVSKADADLGNIPANYDYVVESQLPTADNGNTWYRKYKSGWVEQGGYIIIGEITSGTQSITLPIEMSDNHYWCMLSCVGREGNTGAYSGVTKSSNSTPTTLVLQLYLTGAHNVYWQVSGMSAQ